MINCRKSYARPVAMNMAEEDGKIWMALLNRNGICEVDKKTWNARICKTFEGVSLSKQFLYGCVVKLEHQLIFSPWEAEKIAIYDMKKDFIEYIPIKNIAKHSCKEKQDEAKFWNIFCHHSEVYLFGYSYPAIIRIDMKTRKVIYITDWLEEVEKNIEDGDNYGYFGDGYVMIGELAFIPVGCMNAILELNLKTLHTKLNRINVTTKGIGGISSFDGDNIWITGRGKRTNWIACWNRKTNNLKEIRLDGMDTKKFDPFFAPICTEHKIFLMPISSSCMYEIDIDSEKIQKWKMESVNPENQLWQEWTVMAPRLQNNWLSFIRSFDLKWFEYNIETGESRSYFVNWEEDSKEIQQYFKDVYLKLKEEGKVISENNLSLSYFLAGIQGDNETDFNIYKEKILSGETVYDQICREI